MFRSSSRGSRRWRRAFESDAQLFAFIVQADRLASVSDSLVGLLGCRRGDLLGESITRILPLATWESVVARSERLGGRASHHLVTLEHADGSWIDAALLLWQRDEAKGRCHYAMGCILWDTAEREHGNMREREEMLAYLSHEIRTPVSSLTGLLELLRATDLSPEQLPLVSALDDLAGKIHTLLNDMLDFSRVRAGRMVMHMEDFALRPLLVRMVDTYRVLHPHIVVELAYDESLPSLCHGDSHRIEQALTNALSNAFKFTASGRVRLVARRMASDGPLVRLSVEDTGRGMDSVMLSQLFEPYVSQDAHLGAMRGAGLGMHIARKVAELHGGEVHAESRLGAGTKIHFELPIISRTMPESGGERDSPAEGSALLLLKGAELFSTRRAGRGRRILLVDDNAINMMVVRKFMQLWGYEHDEAFDGVQALERISQEPYALVLMDLRMPTMGGLEATQRVREAHEAWSEVPIIALTASTEGGIRAQMMEAGMDGFIFKPFVADDLRAVIACYLEERVGAAPAAEAASLAEVRDTP